MQPGLLHGIVRLGQRAEHAISDRAQVRPVCLELLCQPVVLVHQSRSPAAIRHSTDGRKPGDVTKTPWRTAIAEARASNRAIIVSEPRPVHHWAVTAMELRPYQDLRHNAEHGPM